PFTTLYPNLGVVRIDTNRSFVIADIPGIIEGAAEGAGLGVQFLKHLQRTCLLLHLVDLAGLDDSIAPVDQVRLLEAEMEQFDPELIQKPRWLVFTKADLLPTKEAHEKARETVESLGWKWPWVVISSVTGEGTRELMQKVSDALLRLVEEAQAPAPDEPDGDTPL
ncbi:MAG: GTPase, partial [Lysobacterales bacterium]